MMMKELKLTKRRKLLGAVVICVILITGSTMLWQMGQVAEAAILDPHPGLVGWWRFDEGAGNIVSDSSGHGNDGTVYGATWVDGKHGKALSFDGVEDHVKVNNHATLQITGDLTIAFWVNTTSLSAAMVPVDKHWAGEYFAKILATGALRFAHGAPGNAEELTVLPAGSITAGSWIHIAVVRNTSTTQLTAYKNGVAGSPVSYTKTPTASTQDVYIGMEDAAYNPFYGAIDEVRIYNRALSQDEIQTLFQKRPDFSANLLAKIPKGTTQVFVTLSWQGIGNINITIVSPSESYTEDMLPIYQKTIYSSDSGDMLNIKRLTVAVTSLSSDESWYIELESDQVEDYKMTVEIQK
jgi:hypothetical protein